MVGEEQPEMRHLWREDEKEQAHESRGAKMEVHRVRGLQRHQG